MSLFWALVLSLPVVLVLVISKSKPRAVTCVTVRLQPRWSSGTTLPVVPALPWSLYLDGDSEKTYITYDSSSTPKAVQHYVNNGGTPFRALAVTWAVDKE